MDIGVFEEMKKIQETGGFKNTQHKVFSFSYIWLVSYLWKYSKYGNMEINTKDLKEILGISTTEKRVDYLIKKNGVLDSLGILETTRDFPIYSDFSGDNGIKITTLSKMDILNQELYLKRYNSRYTCKKPLYQYDSTKRVPLLISKEDTLPINVFEFTRIVLCPELGVDGFFVYCYLKLRSKMFGYEAVRITYAEMEDTIGYKERKLRNVIQNLEMAGMIGINRVVKVTNDNNKNMVRQSNIYSILHKRK